MIFDFSEHIDWESLSPQTAFEEKVIRFLKDWFSSTKTVPVQTSGSTGKPKILEIEKKRMLHSAKITCDYLDLKNGDSALLCLPVEYISGKMMIVRSIERKLKLHLVNPTSTPLEDFNTEINFCAMSPLQVANSLNKIHLIKNLIIGGAQISESLKKKVEKNNVPVANRIFETYGMSETLSHIALKQIFPNAEPYFTILDGVEISKNERGCLTISAPKLNAEILKTNDLVELKNKKQFRFLGRFDNVINSAGLKIYPEELENLVKEQVSNEVIFIGVQNEMFGEKLVMIIEGTESPELKNHLSLLNYPTKNHRPKEIIFMENLPRTPNGKVDRMALKKRWAQASKFAPNISNPEKDSPHPQS
ncbi:AMP-binding protein [Chryseobacterium koreense]